MIKTDLFYWLSPAGVVHVGELFEMRTACGSKIGPLGSGWSAIEETEVSCSRCMRALGPRPIAVDIDIDGGESKLVCHLDDTGSTTGSTLRSACGKSYFAKAHASGLGDPARVDCPECRALIAGVTLVPEVDEEVELERRDREAEQKAGHQELLYSWYAVSASAIANHSGKIAEDMRFLHRKASIRARMYGLEFDRKLDDWHREECEGHESTDGPIGNVVYCDGSCVGLKN